MQKQNKKGFTLAEMLITLSIMGTLMALTIPSLVSSTNKKAYVDALQKAYGLLDMATNQIMMNNSGNLVYAFGTSSDQIANTATMVNKYCNILDCNKKCTIDAVSNGCFNSQSTIKMLNGQNFWDNPNEHAGFVLADGGLVNLIQVSGGANCSWSDLGRTSICALVYIDINGFKGPNIIGTDIFSFYLKNDGLIPDGQIGTFADDTLYCKISSVNARDGQGCTSKVLREGAMNY